VGQYEFLRTQYPGSSLRVQALLAEGQIEQNDLGDAAAAREKYTLLLKLHPKSEQAEEARAGLESLEQWSVVSSQLSEKTVGRKGVPSLPTYPTPASKDRLSGTPVPTPTSNNRLSGTPDRDGAAVTGAQRSMTNLTGPVQGTAVSGQRSAVGGSSSLPAMAQTSGAVPSAHRDGPVAVRRRACGGGCGG
jgi:N-acetylmuramoyl-L-alanine amidase